MTPWAPCRRHRPALEALVERGERRPGTDDALDHLDRCDRCERATTELALTVAALRQVGREARAVAVPAPPRDRVLALAAVRPRPVAWLQRLQLGGLLTGAAIAALLVVPRVGVTSHLSGDALEPVPAGTTAAWRLAERRIAAAPDAPSFAAPGAVPPRYPEGYFRPRKEVFPTDAIPPEFRPR